MVYHSGGDEHGILRPPGDLKVMVGEIFFHFIFFLIMPVVIPKYFAMKITENTFVRSQIVHTYFGWFRKEPYIHSFLVQQTATQSSLTFFHTFWTPFLIQYFRKLLTCSLFQVGDQVWLVPGHCDPTVNMHDNFLGVRKEMVETVWPITGRGPGV